MANLKDIRSRIGSTKSTQKITSALKLVSASKLRKAQNNIVSLRPYALGLKKLMHNFVVSEQANHPLMEKRAETNNVLILVLASDRGLCGSFNSGINKYVENYINEYSTTCNKMDFIFVGKKADEYFARRNIQAKEVITDLAKDVCYEMAAGVAKKVMTGFLEGDYDEVRIVYNEFKSAIQQNVVSERILPMMEEDFKGMSASDDFSTCNDIMIEPSADEILEQLIDKYFATQVYRCMSESVASEHGSRMTAMENATKNAGELIDTLTLTYNKLRQAQITTELTEITSGAEALN